MIDKIILDVIDGNPGAHTVITKLQYFTNWSKMIRYLKKHDIVGESLWELYKDKHKESWHALGSDIQRRMHQENSNRQLNRKKSEFIITL